MHVGAAATGEAFGLTLGALDGSNVPATPPDMIVKRNVARKKKP